MEMRKSITVTQIHTNMLACEPLLCRTANAKPHPDNRVYALHSKDNATTAPTAFMKAATCG